MYRHTQKNSDMHSITKKKKEKDARRRSYLVAIKICRHQKQTSKKNVKIFCITFNQIVYVEPILQYSGMAAITFSERPNYAIWEKGQAIGLAKKA